METWGKKMWLSSGTLVRQYKDLRGVRQTWLWPVVRSVTSIVSCHSEHRFPSGFVVRITDLGQGFHR